MKRCPQCGRDYNDDSMSFCLEDGSELLFGPPSVDEPATAILSGDPSSDGVTRTQLRTAANASSLPSLTSSGAKTRRNVRLIAASLALAVCVLAGLAGYRYFNSNATSEIRSIAVLPFENESEDPDTDYLSEGLGESLIFRLSQLPSLKVSPLSSVSHYKGAGIDIPKVASELGVDSVMTGRMVKRGDNLSITVELVDVRNNASIWGERYERKMADLLSLQRDITTTITQKLQLKLAGNEKGIVKKYTDSNEAYQLYLKGRYHWSKRAAPELRAAIEDFHNAIAADPNFALAYSGLADAYSVLPIYDPTATPFASMPLAKEALSRALAIDDTLAEAHSSQAIVLDIFDWNTTDAEKEYKRAIEINPSYVPAHQWYGEMLCNLGRFDEGLAESRKAVDLEPFYLPGNFALGINLYKARRYDESLAQLARVEELSPEYTDVNSFKYEIYAAKGQYDKAVEMFVHQGAKDGEPIARMQELKLAFDRAGWSGFLRARIGQIESGEAPTEYTGAATTYSYAGEVKKAVWWLNKSVQERNEGMTWLLVDPKFDNLRTDPSFQEVVRRVGFAD